MMWCYIYRSDKKENCYLYMENENDFSAIPENVMSIFGKPVFVMKVLLDGKRRFVVGTSDEIEEKIKVDGFFLQMLHEDDFKV
ncbi:MULTISPECIES: YcgL domain-containing protein [unclassified Gilliamella]|uniref:YcgL domain-containing protein n=2 Tax=Gilliamella TaxID=1193503 RepID=UPI001C6A844A|nr:MULTISPECIES: YcgL domain-containing protein [unclassified Gilliamella]MCX8639197.1 YcgL domain-containing protein [Gilliamella sp. B3172]MCX8600910.1 YcgL domain-containing protein [Gilliamella sp. B3722]MCX8607561.1 YcgL domain-containing protein [Gilliamella sp. B3771]MCX8610132.1 YcgL domain-containing protein [Gilliamella sp. B3891]MCX8612608.1 YcgL domain-containing protein [Gilliamella sp. B3773]